MLLLVGCATAYKPVPDGYTGPAATISDSFKDVGGSSAEFFYVEAVDDHGIDNSRVASLAASRGRGMTLSEVSISRPVPASKPIMLSLVARNEFAAPVLAMTHSVFQVKGKVSFTPDAGRRYVVRGELGDDRSSVWLEEADSGQLIGRKIEVVGSAKLGFFEK